VILDTDIGKDCDDAGALAMLHALANLGEAEILACIYPMNDEWGAAAIAAVNTYYHRPRIPVGTNKRDYPYQGSHDDFYISYLAKNYPNPIGSGKNAPDAVQLYRRVLLEQPDASVTIVVVGPATVVSDLLNSGPDEISQLTGRQIVSRKVRKLVCMSGRFPSGREWNARIAPDATKNIADNWPTPVVYSGAEVGTRIMTGGRLFTETPKNNPVRKAYELCPYTNENNDRYSFDQTAVLYAVRGARNYFDVVRNGHNAVADNGSNRWVPDSGRKHAYLRSKDNSLLKKTIEDLMTVVTNQISYP
jgi:inosine-uridine nucleoside N-ribohydrolase